jgi:soluble lytic murein transglycosylase-like protein
LTGRCFIAGLVLLGLTPCAAAADRVYKFVDADGIVHYTNVRPEGVRNLSTLNFPCYASDPECRKVDWEQVPLETDAFLAEIRSAAADNDLDESLIRAIIHAESAYRPDAVSPRGARGLMQLMPETQDELGVADVFHPASNIRGGATYLAQMLDEFGGDLKLATAAYNAGPGAVHQYGGVPPYPETREYVRRIEILYRRYQRAGG